MNSDDGNKPLEQLRALPPPLQDPLQAARGHRRARASFIQQAQGGRSAVLQRLGRLYFSAEPVLAASVAIVYLGWAMDTLASLWR